MALTGHSNPLLLRDNVRCSQAGGSRSWTDLGEAVQLLSLLTCVQRSQPGHFLGVVQDQSSRKPCYENEHNNLKEPHGEKILVVT